MDITVHYKRVSEILDVLLPRWISTPKLYPYNRPDAIIPQTIIPKALREDTFTLACFYFYLCIYMRGGIESLQAFTALIKLWEERPHVFNPALVQWMQHKEMQDILKQYIGWDSKEASKNWIENSRRLMRNWKGDPLLLIKGLRSYDEALRRIKNKRTKREIKKAGSLRYEGFRGFQPKMVSMLVYFYDWEGWLEVRFNYPSPADFHNFRLGIANGAIVVTNINGHAHANEKMSAPWRKAIMRYLKERGADPLEVSDAVWLFSLLMCGNSPATLTKTLNNLPNLFSLADIKEEWRHSEWVAHRGRKKLEQTCLVCPFLTSCEFAIPSQPYYRKGQLILRPRYKAELGVDLGLLKEPTPSEVVVEEEVQYILSHLESPSTTN